MDRILMLIQAAVTFGTVILYGSLGEILTEKSGHLNLGVPGIMYIGGISGLAGAYFYESAGEPIAFVSMLISLLAALAGSALAGLLYSFLTVTLRANQNVTGLTLTIFGAGVANFYGASLMKLAGGVGQISVSVTSSAYRATIPFLRNIPVLSTLLFRYGWLVYVAVVIAFVMHHFIYKTRTGLNLRAVGENPATADAVGIRVTRYKYLATCIGSAVCGLGGLFYVMDYTKGTWANDGTIERLGWLAVALVIFSIWRPRNAIWGAYLFGFLYWMYMYISGLSRGSQELFKMLPYVVTLMVLIFVSLRKKRETQAPSSLGLSYFREDR